MENLDDIKLDFTQISESDHLAANNTRQNQVAFLESIDKTTILNELQSLKKQFHQSEEENKIIVLSYSHKIKRLKNELNEIFQNSNKLFKYNLPILPFTSHITYMEYEKKLAQNYDSKKSLRHFIKTLRADDYSSFIKKAIKTFIADDLAVRFCWRGTNSKLSVQTLILITIIKDITMSRYIEPTEKQINRVIHQHFLHANDRLKRKQKSST